MKVTVLANGSPGRLYTNGLYGILTYAIGPGDRGGELIRASYHPLTLKIGTLLFLRKTLNGIELTTVDPADRDPVCY